MVDYYRNLISKYPIISIEDGLAEDELGRLADHDAKTGKKDSS